MPRSKMIPLAPESLGGSEHDRFKRFAKAVLSVPKTEITPTEELLEKLQSEKQKVDPECSQAG